MKKIVKHKFAILKNNYCGVKPIYYKLLSFLIIYLLSSNAFSSDINLYLGQISKHDKCCYKENEETKQYNSTHHLIGISYNNLLYMNFDNSYGNNSHLIGYALKIDRTYVSPHIIFGLVNGYDEHIRGINDAIAPAMLVGADIHPKHDKFGLVINAVPGTFVSLGLRIKLR